MFRGCGGMRKYKTQYPKIAGDTVLPTAPVSNARACVAGRELGFSVQHPQGPMVSEWTVREKIKIRSVKNGSY